MAITTYYYLLCEMSTKSVRWHVNKQEVQEANVGIKKWDSNIQYTSNRS